MSQYPQNETFVNYSATSGGVSFDHTEHYSTNPPTDTDEHGFFMFNNDFMVSNFAQAPNNPQSIDYSNGNYVFPSAPSTVPHNVISLDTAHAHDLASGYPQDQTAQFPTDELVYCMLSNGAMMTDSSVASCIPQYNNFLPVDSSYVPPPHIHTAPNATPYHPGLLDSRHDFFNEHPQHETAQWQSYTTDENSWLGGVPQGASHLRYTAPAAPVTHGIPIVPPAVSISVPPSHLPNSTSLDAYASPAQSTTESSFSQNQFCSALYRESQNMQGKPAGFSGTVRPAKLEKRRRIEMSKDLRFLEIIERVLNIMTEVNLPLDGPVSFPLSYQITRQKQRLDDYLASTPLFDAELQEWLRSRRSEVGKEAGTAFAHGRRKAKEDGKIFMCLWCNHTLTTKNNMGNHVRSHFNFDISFCDYPDCQFGSVTQSLPDRHSKQHTK